MQRPWWLDRRVLLLRAKGQATTLQTGDAWDVRKTDPALRTAVLLLAVAAIPVALDGTGGGFTLARYLANALPWLLAATLALGLLRRPLSSVVAVWMAALAFHGVNDIKQRELGLPLLPSDVLAVPQMLASPTLYWRYLDWSLLLQAIALCMVFGFLCRWLWGERTLVRRWRKAHVGLLLIGLLGLASLQGRSWPWPQFYDQERLAIAFWDLRQAAQQSGEMALFMLLHQHTRASLPEPDVALLRQYEEAVARSGTLPQVTVAARARPDIIVVQSESFFDPGIIDGIDGAQHVPILRALQQQHLHGTLAVPTYGGLTSRTEFEFLTGYPLSSSPQLQYPFQGLVHRPMYSFAWALRNAGYAASALHPYDPDFYARRWVYPRMGFEHFHSVAQFRQEDYFGYYVSDAAMNRRIMELLDGEGPTFLFAVSIENHGPWDSARPLRAEQYASIEVPPNLSSEHASEFQRFLLHLRRADQALGELAQWVMQRAQPTVLLFYGDHLPNLADNYSSLTFLDGEPANRQRTPWVLVDNRVGRAGSERVDLATHQLAALLSERAGPRELPLFAEIDRLRRGIPEAAAEVAEQWHRHLAAQHLGRQPDEPLWQMREGKIAQVRKWGPQSHEQDDEPVQALPLYAELDSPASSRAYLAIGTRPLVMHVREERLISGYLSLADARHLLAEVAELEVHLIDPDVGMRQRLGLLEVRPRAPRLGGFLGFGAGEFCEVTNWGPRSTRLDHLDNTQPDGSMGLWAQSGCFPAGSRFQLGGQELATAVEGKVATATVSPQLLAVLPDRSLALLAPSGERLELGHIELLEAVARGQ